MHVHATVLVYTDSIGVSKASLTAWGLADGVAAAGVSCARERAKLHLEYRHWFKVYAMLSEPAGAIAMPHLKGASPLKEDSRRRSRYVENREISTYTCSINQYFTNPSPGP